jgi:hypothetical protein
VVGLVVGGIALGQAWSMATAAPAEPEPEPRAPVCTAYEAPAEDTYVVVDGTAHLLEVC